MQQKPARHVAVPCAVRLPIGWPGVRKEIALGQESWDEEDPAGGDLAHELRTSLAIITLLSGNLDLLYDRLDDEKRQRMIRDIRKQMQRLNALMDDVLELCNDSGPIPL
jgi:light-regulated signal transduction histidine kinase (bacteriophytochrome)